jgi:hypothetical protein
MDLAGNTVIQLGQPVASGNSAWLAFKNGPGDAFCGIRYEDSALHFGSFSKLPLPFGGALIDTFFTRISFGPHGLAFNDKSPLQKPTISGSRQNDTVPVLQSLLKSLDNLGLITDATTP